MLRVAAFRKQILGAATGRGAPRPVCRRGTKGHTRGILNSRACHGERGQAGDRRLPLRPHGRAAYRRSGGTPFLGGARPRSGLRVGAAAVLGCGCARSPQCRVGTSQQRGLNRVAVPAVRARLPAAPATGPAAPRGRCGAVSGAGLRRGPCGPCGSCCLAGFPPRYATGPARPAGSPPHTVGYRNLMDSV